MFGPEPNSVTAMEKQDIIQVNKERDAISDGFHGMKRQQPTGDSAIPN